MTEALFQEGVQKLVDRWSQAAGGLLNRRLEGALGMNFLFECPGATSKMLRFNRDSVDVGPATQDARPHAVFAMPADDWRMVFSGEWSVMTVVLAGRAPFPKHHRRSIMQLSMVMQALFLLKES